MSTEQEAREAAIRSQAYHWGRHTAAEAIRDWTRTNWPTVAEGMRVWNTMPETLARVAEGEGLAAAVRRSVNELLAAEATGSCCQGRSAGHMGACWPLGATHPPGPAKAAEGEARHER